MGLDVNLITAVLSVISLDTVHKCVEEPVKEKRTRTRIKTGAGKWGRRTDVTETGNKFPDAEQLKFSLTRN